MLSFQNLVFKIVFRSRIKYIFLQFLQTQWIINNHIEKQLLSQLIVRAFLTLEMVLNSSQ